MRARKQATLVSFIRKWIYDHTTPSSNTKNTIQFTDPATGLTEDHVIHWRTETINTMFMRCKLEAAVQLRQVFEFSFFYKLIPAYVRPRKKQDGLCPIHHTGKLGQSR